MKDLRTSWILAAIALAIPAAIWLLSPADANFKQVAFWQRLASPGELSAAHARLEKNCNICHSSFGGIGDADCIGCHALDERLLSWPENIFHADVGNCIGCHPEHLGRTTPAIRMDHSRLSRLILARLQNAGQPAGSEGTRIDQLAMWLRHQADAAEPATGDFQVRPEERLLNCYACHAGSDIHAGLFGRDCLQCHQTRAWTIPGYRHPPGRSTDCRECHKAPKSHFRGHFKKMPGRVADCYMCHRIPSWRDIGHPPWYRKWLQQLQAKEAEAVESLFDESAETGQPPANSGLRHQRIR